MISSEIYENCIEQYSDLILRIAVNYCKNMEDAKDIVQDVFLKLLKSDKNFSDEEHIKHWLIRVTVNTCKNYLSSGFVKRTLCMPEEQLHEAMDPIGQQFYHEDERGERVFLAVKNLPDKLRIVVMLYYYEDYTVSEISSILKKSESVILTRLHRARKKLKEELKGVWQDE